jgi:hypothetical protein
LYYRKIASPQRPRLDDAARDEQRVSGGAVASHAFLQLWSVEGRFCRCEEQEEEHGVTSYWFGQPFSLLCCGFS